jgi:hypothetical protein
MGVDATIVLAQYGINKMKTNAEPFDFYFRGTLVCLKGILDYILEEYNVKYSVGIGFSENLNADSFDYQAKARKNAAAASFIASYKTERNKLLADPRCAKLLKTRGSRDIEIHRRELPRDTWAFRHLGVTVNVGDDAEANSQRREIPNSRPEPVEIRYFLQDWQNDDIPTLCELTLNALRNFVATLRSNYP